MKLKIAIFGSNSFSGSEAANFFLKKGYEVFCFSKNHSKINSKLKSKFYSFNINNKKDVDKAIKILNKKKISYIINYISKSLVAESWKNPSEWYFTNSFSLPYFYFELRKVKKIRKVIHFSTPEVYGNTSKKISENNIFLPSTPYAVSRVTGDQTLEILNKYFKLPYIITRASNVYGENQDEYRIIPKTINFLLNRKVLPLDGGGKTKRNFIHINDVNNALLTILKKGAIGECYHISGDDIISIKKLVKLISKKVGTPYKRYIKISKDRLGKDLKYHLDSRKLKKLRWKANIKIEKGIDMVVNFILRKSK